MTTVFYLLLILAPFALLFTAFSVVKKKSEGRPLKKAFSVNIATFAVLTVLMSVLCINAFAANDTDTAAEAATQTEETAEAPASDNSKGLGLLAAAWLQVLRVSAAVSPLPQAHRRPFPQPRKIRNLSVNPSFSWHSANPLHFTAWLFPF